MELNINPEFGKSDSENDCSRSESEKSYKGKSSEEDFRNSDTESDNEREISYDSLVMKKTLDTGLKKVKNTTPLSSP